MIFVDVTWGFDLVKVQLIELSIEIFKFEETFSSFSQDWVFEFLYLLFKF